MKKCEAPKNRLRELRDRSRLTLEEVSLITGISPAAISRHENGSRGLSEANILKYAALYKVNTHELFINTEGAAGDADNR